MAKIISFSSDRSRQLREQQLERRRQQAGHCSCGISPEPESPPKLEWTAGGWRCSVCKAIMTGKHP